VGQSAAGRQETGHSRLIYGFKLSSEPGKRKLPEDGAKLLTGLLVEDFPRSLQFSGERTALPGSWHCSSSGTPSGTG